MTSGDAEQCAATVGVNLLDALQHWDGADLRSINESRALLDRSVTDLRQLTEAVTAGIAVTTRNREHLLAIRSSISRWLRLVDAASAMVAGMSGTAADMGIFYNALGAQQPIPGRPEVLCRV